MILAQAAAIVVGSARELFDRCERQKIRKLHWQQLATTFDLDRYFNPLRWQLVCGP